MQKQHRRGPWNQNEDAHLVDLVRLHGASNWVKISEAIRTRSPKQCRERYHQNLKPNLNLEPITPEEGARIEQMVAEMGKRWAEIARRLGNRSDNTVKNYWNGGQNRRRRRDNRRMEMSSGPGESKTPPTYAQPAPPVASRFFDMSQGYTSQMSMQMPQQSMSHFQMPPRQNGSPHGESYKIEDTPPSMVSDTSSDPYNYSPQSPLAQPVPPQYDQRESYMRMPMQMSSYGTMDKPNFGLTPDRLSFAMHSTDSRYYQPFLNYRPPQMNSQVGMHNMSGMPMTMQQLQPQMQMQHMSQLQPSMSQMDLSQMTQMQMAQGMPRNMSHMSHVSDMHLPSFRDIDNRLGSPKGSKESRMDVKAMLR